jgi:hypothetical protein
VSPKHIQDSFNSANDVSTVEALIAVSEIANSRIGFSAAVERIERVLVGSGPCTGLVVLEKRGNASFPLAGNGGPLYRSRSDAIYSRSVRLAMRDLKIVLFVRAAGGRRLHVLADFVAEQVAAVARRFDSREPEESTPALVKKIG